jgi:hypothetical protein
MAVSLFFITFVIFQPPSAAMGRWLGAKHWIAFIMASSFGLYLKMLNADEGYRSVGEFSRSPMLLFVVVMLSSLFD